MNDELKYIDGRAREIDAESWQRWLDAGYKLFGKHAGKNADALLQRKIIRRGETLFFSNVWVYFQVELHKARIGFMPEAQFNQAGAGFTFDVTVCGNCDEPAAVESFFLAIFGTMNCKPEDA